MGSFVLTNLNGNNESDGYNPSPDWQQMKRDLMISNIELEKKKEYIICIIPVNKYISKIISEYYISKRCYNNELLTETINLKNITNKYSDWYFKQFKYGIEKVNDIWCINSYQYIDKKINKTR